jgi:tyrosinase
MTLSRRSGDVIDIDRRDILSGSASLGLLMALGGCESIFNQIRNRPLRRDVSTMGPSDPMLQAYREGVRLMKLLDHSDPRSWSRQADTHENSCPHGNWFFLPWHRAFLMSLERIIRELTGVQNFALPYWNWSCQTAIPAPFWEAGSPLFHADRWIGPTDHADGAVVGPDNINALLAETDFELFASGFATTLRPRTIKGPLESGPHDYIHASFVGGTMYTMRSPLDPIFWLHHNILDYLWFDWNSRGNANTNHPAYTGLMIPGMVDGAGNEIPFQVGALVLAPLLSYRFEPPRRCFRLSDHILDEIAIRRFVEQGAEQRLRVRIAFPPVAKGMTFDPRERQRTRIELPAQAVRAALAPDARQRLILRVEGIRPPTDGTYVRVFVGLPEGEAPSPESPYYAGAFAFFVGDHDDGGHGGALDYHVDLTPAFDKLRATGRLRDPEHAAVTFVPVRPERAPLAAAYARPLAIGQVVPLLIDSKPKPTGPK